MTPRSNSIHSSSSLPIPPITLTKQIQATFCNPNRIGHHGMIVGCLTGLHRTPYTQPTGIPSIKISLKPSYYLQILYWPLLKYIHKLPTQPPIEDPMEILGGFPSCLERVDIAPPKPNYSSGRVFLNPNETMAQRALQN
jgi:hypothetical protein